MYIFPDIILQHTLTSGKTHWCFINGGPNLPISMIFLLYDICLLFFLIQITYNWIFTPPQNFQIDQEDVHIFWSRSAMGAVILWMSCSILW